MVQQLGNVAVESIVKINENGSPVELYVSKHDYEPDLNGAGRTLVVRKDVYDNRVWDSGNVNAYASSDLDSWFNSTYKNMLDADIRSLIGTTKIRYTPGNGNNTVGTLERAIFALSLTELGERSANANTEGSALPIASTLKIAYQNGYPTDQWTRSPDTSANYLAWMLYPEGYAGNLSCNYSSMSRPAFTLPSYLYVSDDGTIGSPIPTLTVPQMVMQGQQATINWSAIERADSYTLQRKANTDTDWTQVYSGTALTFSETVGTWTSLQYRVQAVFSGTPGGWATSDPIQIVSASALVISGQDGDLGTLVNDVPYSISSDQTSPTIDVTVEVNGGEYAAFQATSGQTYTIGVLDLPTGTGSIVITASTEVSSSPVTVTRTWTYSKTAQTFPNSGSVATLTKEGNVVYPETLVEAVRASMTPWGGNLSTALELLKRAALFNRTKQPKYSEVTISLSGKTEGQTIQLPEGGKMVEFYVSKINYEEGLNGTGRVLVVRKNTDQDGVFSHTGINEYDDSTMDDWFNETYLQMLDETVQSQIGTTKFYYTPGNGDYVVTTLEKPIFALSCTELGFSNEDFNVEGEPLPIYDILRAAYAENGLQAEQHTRTPNTSDNRCVWDIAPSGELSTIFTTTTRYAGYRPCFTLPSTFSATYYVDNQGGIHPSQEYTEAGDWLDVWGNAIPAVKIETGSYVGTGTSGASNPNTLTFGFEPHVVIVAGMSNSNPGTGGDGNVEVGLFFPDILQEAYKASSYFLIGRSGSQYCCAKFEDATNTLSWYYYTSGAGVQLNYSGKTYCYIAIG